MKRNHLGAVAIAAAILLAACGGGESRSAAAGGDGQELVIAFDGSPTNLDPRIGTDTHSGRIWDMTASGLIRLTPSGDFTGDIAERWETPDDQTIIFHLKPNAKFQDGRPVRARDFKFTFDSLMAESFNSPKKSGYASVASFEAPDDRTFIVRLKEPNAGIFDNFPYMLVPEGADAEKFSRDPILAGAYKVSEFRTDERITLDAFNEWVNGKPNIPRIVVRIVPDATTRVLELKRGTIHFAINSIPLDQVPQFQNNPDFKIERSPGGAYQYLAF
ncbi:MAG TPA: ABC transporter substrate-binding protein, partial [Thermoanaerobaculia bacterium]|nr:ABC transporter substrate-binding protein [Thermoanaerobaculia bacterium]